MAHPGSDQRIRNALTAHRIPLDPYASLAGISVSPFGLPYIQLPAPFEHVSLSNYIWPPDAYVPSPDRTQPASASADASEPMSQGENDAQVRTRIYSLPTALPWFSGSEADLAVEEEKVRKEVERPWDWCFPAIRRTPDVLSSPRPPLIGVVKLRPAFQILPRISVLPGVWDNEKPKVGETAGLDGGRREVHWSMSVILDPAVEGKGAMTAALNYVLRHFYAPHVHTFPGQLISLYHRNNLPSAGLHRRAGFLPVAKSRVPKKAAFPPASSTNHVATLLSERGVVAGAAEVGEPGAVSSEPSGLDPAQVAGQGQSQRNENEAGEGQTESAKGARGGPPLERGEWIVWNVWQGLDGSEPVGKDDSMFRPLEAYDF